MRLKPYVDSVGKTSIGVGRNLDDVGVSKDEAMYMLENDMNMAEQLAARHHFYLLLNEPRRAVIVSMVFNMGLAGFSGFKSMIAAITAGDFDRAAEEMLNSKWATQVKRRSIELAYMMRTGEWIIEASQGSK